MHTERGKSPGGYSSLWGLKKKRERESKGCGQRLGLQKTFYIFTEDKVREV